MIEQFAQASCSLVSESESLLSLASGQEGGQAIVHAVRDLLHNPLEYLSLWRSEMSLHQDILKTCADILSGMLTAEHRLQDTVSPLRHMQTMFKIESARLDEGVRQVFAGLTEKIEFVRDKVRDTFLEQFRIVAQNDVIIRQVWERVRGENARLHTMIASHRSDIESSLQQLEVEIERNMTRDVRLRDVSKSIAEQVRELVVVCQLQDILSQRLQHVCSALRSIDRDTPGGDMKLILELQVGQLKSVLADLEGARSSVESAAGHIGQAVSSVDDKCLRLNEFGEVTASATGTVQVLLDTVTNARGLTTTAVESAKESADRIRPIADSATGLIGALETLAIEMHLIALNAQIQAVQIGDKTGLEVLAAHTASISRDTESLVQTVGADVKHLSDQLRNIAGALEKLAREGATHRAVLESVGQEQQERLHAFRDRTLAQLRTVGGLADTLQVRTEDLKRQAGALAALLSPISDVIETVEAAAGELPEAPHGEQGDLVAAYTMASERRVHEQILTNSAAASGGSDCGVELF